MTLFAKLAKAQGLGGDYLAEASVAGPASYLSGGFTVDTGLSTVSRFICVPRDSQIGAATDFVRVYSAAEAAGVITIVVSQVQLSATNTYAEVPDTTDLSAQTWDVIAVGQP